MKAVIVGAGPVGCLLAIELRRRSLDVAVFDKGNDPRWTQTSRSHSFNLTLSRRGLGALEPELRDRLYHKGVRLPHRVVHRLDGSISLQPYGISADHHLLSIPRRTLHALFVDEAERAGARLHFRHECLCAEPNDPSATFAAGSSIRRAAGDLLVGCDGANSIVRQEVMSAAGLAVSQERIAHGYIELTMPASAPTSLVEGLHVWPRGDFMLIAQPNIDRTFTSTLFLRFTSNSAATPSFETLTTSDDVERFFRRYFPDVMPHLTHLRDEFHDAAPAPLRSLRCQQLHHGYTVLLGDAAHTMLPFYGQGINCGFEDVRVLLDLLGPTLSRTDPSSGIRQALTEFSETRRRPCDAITTLSNANLTALMNDVGDVRFDARAQLEQELHRRYPQRFAPLYCGVAFSTTPYDDVLDEYVRRHRTLESLCEKYDPAIDSERIIAAYADSAPSNGSPETEHGGLELTRVQRERLLERTMSRILAHEGDLAAGRYPASYIYDSIHVSQYESGKRLSSELREDTVPYAGTALDSLLSEIFDRAIESGTTHPHPGFMAHIPSGGLLEGAVGDFIARSLNRFAGVWIAAPGLIQLESNVIRWFCGLLGYDERAFGYLTTSGSIANMMGLMCACRRQDGPATACTTYASEQAHFSIGKGARLIGIASAHQRTIAVRRDYTIDIDTLVEQIESDRANGLVPVCVVATAGTTNTGAVDDLAGLGGVCRRYGIWLHVDACFGGFFRITGRGRAALRGIEGADSIAVDGHKSLFLPHGSSALLVKDRAHLGETFKVPESAYLPGSSQADDLVDFCNYGPELSREIRGLTAWLPLKMHGIGAFERCLDEKLDLAIYLADMLERIDGIEVIRNHPIHLPVVAFRVRCRGERDESHLNEHVCERICSNGRVYVTTTTLPDRGVVIRACILNHRTNRATIDQLLADVRGALQG